MNEIEIRGVQALLETPKKIAVIPHRSPDGDAMGSTLALYHFLKKLGHEPTVISPNDFPHFLRWLPASDSVVIFESDRPRATKILEEAEVIFTLDFNVLSRTGDMEHVLNKLSAPFIMIDHHQMPGDYALYRFSDTSYGSTCEMVYRFITYLEKNDLIDRTIATCIYCGIVTDSGSFRFPSTTAETHRIVAELISKGVRNGEVHENLYDNNSYENLQLLGKALSNLRLMPDQKTSFTTLSAQELDACNFVKGDTEGIVNYGLSIKGITFTAIFIEYPDEGIVKISFRSKGDFDVNRFAREHFNGGGHINAAGGKSVLPMQETVDKFIEIVKNQHP